MKKVVLAAALLALMLVVCFSLVAADDPSVIESEGLLFRIGENGAEVVGYQGGGRILRIPARINGCDVVAVGPYAFRSDETLWMVLLPETVRTIGKGAFHYSHVRCVYLPDSLETIEDSAFSHSWLDSVYIPSSVTQIGSHAFASCFNLRSACLDAQIEELPERSFFECIHLYDVILPPGLKRIGEEAFYFCTSLEVLSMPESLDSIGLHAFWECESLYPPIVDPVDPAE